MKQQNHLSFLFVASITLATVGKYVSSLTFVPTKRFSLMTSTKYEYTSRLLTSTNNNNESGRHSFVEGEEYEDVFDEVEALGGDPFFLGSDDDNHDLHHMSDIEKKENEESIEYKATDGYGPKPVKYEDIDVDEWDGREIEDAYFDD